MSTEQWVELFKDSHFEKGIIVFSVDRNSQKVFDFGDPTRLEGTRWEMAQHFSKYDLITAEPTVREDGAVVYENPGKRLTLHKENGENVLQMEMLASTEYDAPRREGEAWPHLLVEQNLASDTLDCYDRMIFSMTIRKDYIHNYMQEGYDPTLHCYQNGMIFIVQNTNPASAGYGEEFFWFGVAGFDSRYEYKDEYCNIDVGKEDASGRLIYQLGGKAFYDTYYTANPMTHEGEWCTVTVDILPALQKGLQLAQSVGQMQNTTFADLTLQQMNLGCECPGTFDASLSLKHVSLRCRKVK